MSKDTVRVKIIHDYAVDYMLEEFTCDARKRDWKVVFNVTFVGFFKKGRDNHEFPIVWDNALVKGGLKEYLENVS